MTDRPGPIGDDLTRPFWEAARRHELVIQRCAACRTWMHPPRTFCWKCRSTELAFEPVSGRGVVYSYTRTESGARHPYFEARTPYLVGVVELVEQKGLMLLTNFPGATLDQLSVGAPVEVVFEQCGAGQPLPQFRLVEPPRNARSGRAAGAPPAGDRG